MEIIKWIIAILSTFYKWTAVAIFLLVASYSTIIIVFGAFIWGFLALVTSPKNKEFI